MEANPFELSVIDQLAALRRANDEESWDIPEETFNRLAETAPEWPQGRHAFRSLRIRFGEGDEGVVETLKAHVKRISTVFNGACYGQDELKPEPRFCQGGWMQTLRLLVGNRRHKPVVEWIVIGADQHRDCHSIRASRRPESLADELLVLAWLFPNYVQSLNQEKHRLLIAGGYEIDSTNEDDLKNDPWLVAKWAWERTFFICWDDSMICFQRIGLEELEELNEQGTGSSGESWSLPEILK